MKNKILILCSIVALLFASCSESVLDRQDRVNPNDETFWTTEDNARLFANGFYTNYFVGYNTSWTVGYAPVRGMYFSDNFANGGTQISFTDKIEAAPGNASFFLLWDGAGWSFSWVRKANLFIDRLEKMEDKLSEEALNHWLAVARFFKAWEYCRLVLTLGDVPYFDKHMVETDTDMMYKDREPRAEVVEKIIADFKFAYDNVRLNDGSQTVNKYIVAAAISRFMLFEGTWQKYHYNNDALAKKCLDFSIEAADFVISSGKYKIASDFHTLFGSQDLKGEEECILFRHYDLSQSVAHSVASYCNTNEGQSAGANLALLKSFLCNDGKTYHDSQTLASTSSLGEKFCLDSLIKTRDPRFEASFYFSYYRGGDTANKTIALSPTLLYCNKFIDRDGTEVGKFSLPQYSSMTNTNDFPVFRYGELLLNWIEAKAELATMGGAAVSQADIDVSINALRNRPIDKVAENRGVKKTAPMQLANLPNDPDRDADVSDLIWEIRRERRMELVYEYSRLLDIKRWKKLDYMKTLDAAPYPDNMLGLWINFKEELPSRLNKDNSGKITVQKEDGTLVVYKAELDAAGTIASDNAADMVGFFVIQNAKARTTDVSDKQYLAPVSPSHINEYATKGYTLTQTKLWE